jgi:hypothetical protein
VTTGMRAGMSYADRADSRRRRKTVAPRRDHHRRPLQLPWTPRRSTACGFLPRDGSLLV